MAVSNIVALAIVTLVFYVLAAPFAVICGFKHGIKRSAPWYFMTILVLARIIGEPMTIATNGVLDPNNDVSIAGAVLSNIGLSPLLLMAGAIVQNVNTMRGEANSQIPVTYLRLMNVVPLVSLIISIIGSTDSYSDDASKRATGMSLRVAASALYIVYWFLVAGVAFMLFKSRHFHSEKRSHIFLGAVIISLPFLAVRVIDQCLLTFGSTADQLANANNVLIKALMGSLMEFVVVIVYLAAGMLAGKAPVPQTGSYRSEQTQDAEMGKYSGPHAGQQNGRV